MSVAKFKHPDTGSWVSLPVISVINKSTPETLPHADIPDYVKEAALEVAQKVQAVRKEDSIVFLAMSDSHHCSQQSDTSWQENTNDGNLHACMAAKILAYGLKFDFVCHLGDFTFGNSTTTSALLHQQIGEMNSYLAEAFQGIPQFRTVGNHDTGLYAQEAGNSSLEGTEYLFSVIGSHCKGAVYGSVEFGYCYRDFDDRKLRVICLNTSEGESLSGNDAAWICSPEQLLWFAQTLYEAGSMDGWSIIVLSHYPLDYLGTHPASAIVKAYVEGGNTIQNGTTIDFSGHNAAKFVAQFHGHTHCFKYAKLNLINMTTLTAEEFDAWRVAVPNSSFYRNNHQTGPDKYGLYFEEDTTYNKTAGTVKDTAFVVNVVNPSEQVIHSFCYGAGFDRVIGYAATVYYSITRTLNHATLSNDALSAEEGAAYSAAVSANEGFELASVTVTMGSEDITDSVYADGVITIPAVSGHVTITANAVLITSYTNQIPISTDADGSIYNGIGYKSGYRLDSSGIESALSGMHLTGYIPCKFGDYIYLKNITFQSGTDTSGNQRLSFYDADRNHLCQTNATGAYAMQVGNDYDYERGEDGIYTKLIVGSTSTFDTSDAAFFRLNATYIGADSIITVNEEIT